MGIFTHIIITPIMVTILIHPSTHIYIPIHIGDISISFGSIQPHCGLSIHIGGLCIHIGTIPICLGNIILILHLICNILHLI